MLIYLRDVAFVPCVIILGGLSYEKDLEYLDRDCAIWSMGHA